MTVALAVLGLLAGTWLTWRMPTLGAAAGRRRSVSIVVPARDEEHRLPTLLRSLPAEPAGSDRGDGAGVEVIVVDDGSTDETARLAAGLGATVLAAGEPPPGWLGKPWACQRGADAASGESLVFLDADVELSAGALDRLLGELDRCGGLVSVLPHHRTLRPSEELSAYFNAVEVMGVGAFTPVRHRAPAGAFGPCLATSAADYRAAGGHAGVRDRLLDDVHLARRYRACGLPVTCRVGGDDVRFRMYPAGIGQLVEGWSKNIALGAVGTGPSAAGAAAMWVAATATIAAAALSGTARWLAGGTGLPWLALAGWLLVAAQLHWILRRLGTFRWWTALGFVLPLAAFVAIFGRSVVLSTVRRRVRWRGRTVVLGRSGPEGPGAA